MISKHNNTSPIFLLFFIYFITFQSPVAKALSISEALTTIRSKNDREGDLLQAYKTAWNHYLYQKKQDSLHFYLQDALQYYDEEENRRGYVEALTYQARSVSVFENAYSATPLFKNAIQYAETYDPSFLSRVHALISINYRARSEIDSASIYIYQALEHCESKKEKIKTRMILADIQMDAGEFQKAKENLTEILSNEEILNPIEIYIVQGNLVTTFAYLKDYENYARGYKRLIELQGQFETPSSDFHANSFFYTKLPLQEQEEFLRNSLKAFEKIGYHNLISRTKFDLVSNLFQQRKYSTIIDQVSEWSIVKDTTLNPEFKESIISLTKQSYANANNYGEAFKYAEIELKLKDSLKLLADKKVFLELQEKYEATLKDKELEKQKNEIQSKTYQRNILLGGIGSLGLAGFIFFWGLISRNAKNKRIHEQDAALKQERIEKLEQEKKFLAMSSLLEGQESERIRIAKDLHDGLGGLLTTVKTHFEKINEEIGHVKELDIYTSANEMIDKAHEEVRRISHNLMPTDLRAGGLEVAIDQIEHELSVVHGLSTDFEIVGLAEERLSEKIEVAVYRIVQELINNTVKYANAKTVFLQINKFKDELQVIVEDDGVGFDLEMELNSNKGIGLRSIVSRVDHLKGNIDINSSTGKGTSVTINIPLSKNP